MVIINKPSSTQYSVIAHRSIGPGGKSAEADMGNLGQALKDVLTSCGKEFIVRLNDEERKMILRLQDLDRQGSAYQAPSKRATHFDKQLLAEEHEKQAKMARIADLKQKEAAIYAETTYASRADVATAQTRAGQIKGEVKAKKLESKDVTGTVSLNDLMGDNKFIEERMQHTHIPTAVASEDGWDMKKLQESQDKKAPAPFQEISANPLPAESPSPKADRSPKPRKGSRK